MKNLLKLEYVPFYIAVLNIIVSGIFYPSLPNTIATHWGISGQADGYSSKLFGLLFLPGLLFILYGIFKFFISADPYKKNIEKFKKQLDIFIIGLFVFFTLVNLLTILWNLGYQWPFNISMPLLFGLLFVFLGIMLKDVKQNWFMGIRTPWTLNNSEVWERTHSLGSKLFIISGLIIIASALVPKYSFYILITILLITVIFLYIYSYILYRRIKK